MAIPTNIPSSKTTKLIANRDKIRIVVVTNQYKIEGDIHIIENSRLSDMLNSEKNHKLFIPLTNVVCFSVATGEKLFTRNFLTISKSFITMVYVDEHSQQAAKNYITACNTHIENGKFHDALIEARKAAAIDPENAEAHYLLGIAYGKLYKLNEAYKQFNLAMELADPSSKIYFLASDMKNQLKL